MQKIQKITPFLWFDSKAEEAAEFYTTIFSEISEDSKILNTTYYDEAGAEVSEMPQGSVMTVSFKLAGQHFVALNGGTYFKFSGAISFVINCETQAEVDYFWEKLSEGGESGQCGWINRDKFGVTWQVVPVVMEKFLSDPDKEKAGRAMRAMLKMNKLIIADLEEAYNGK